MEEVKKYFDSIKDKVEIEASILDLIIKAASKNPSLQKVNLQNVDAIIKSKSHFKAFEFEMWLKNLSLPFNIQSSLDDHGKFVIAKRHISKIEPNSLRVRTESCGVVQFRVPPNTIKTDNRVKRLVAQYYV